LLLEQIQKKLKLAKDNYSVDDFIANKHQEAVAPLEN
jgi:hypothetical protein